MLNGNVGEIQPVKSVTHTQIYESYDIRQHVHTTPYGPLKGDTSYGIQQMNEWKDIIKIKGDPGRSKMPEERSMILLIVIRRWSSNTHNICEKDVHEVCLLT